MKINKHILVTGLLALISFAGIAQSKLNGRFYISGASEVASTPNSNYSIEGTFTDLLYIYSAADILPGDIIADFAGLTYKIDKVTSISGNFITVDATYLEGAPNEYATYPTSYATGTLFRPTPNGYSQLTNDPEYVNEALKIGVLNSAILSIDKDIRGFKSGTEAEMPKTPKAGDLFYNVTEKKLYAYTADGWVPVGGGVIASGTTAEFPNPAKAGEMFLNKDDNKTYIYNGALWLELSTNGSTPSANINPDPTKVSVKEGDLFYNISDHKLYVYNGTVWMAINNLLRNGQIFVGNASNTPVSVALTGDATITNIGKLTIQPLAITDEKLDKTKIPLSGFGIPLDNVSMGDEVTNFKIINLANPSANSDAATKGYVDALVSTPASMVLANNNFLVGNNSNKAIGVLKSLIPISGFDKAGANVSMGGGTPVTNFKITNMADPTAAQDAATKAYVDGRQVNAANILLPTGNFLVGDIAGKAVATLKNTVSLTGFAAPTADIAAGGFKITGLANPVDAQDAATKGYIDTKTFDPASINLAKDLFMIGDVNGKATGIEKNTIPLSGFKDPATDISMAGFLLTNIGTPLAETDATNKKYVDGLFSTPSSILALPAGNLFVGNNSTGKATATPKIQVPLSGFGKATENVNMGDAVNQFNISFLKDPVFEQDAATKNYVDSKLSTPGVITLSTDHIFVGDASNKANGVLKNTVPVSDFGVAIADVAMGDGTTNFKITSLAEPTTDQDAATKKYVDSKTSETPTGPTAPTGAKAGDTYYNTLEGRLYVYNGTTWVPVDNKLSDGHLFVGSPAGIAVSTPKNVVPLSGFGSAQGDVAMGNFKLINLAEPTLDQDAATKKYVDAKTVKMPTGPTAPANPVVGDTYYNTAENRFYVFNGTGWVAVDNKLATGELYVGNAAGIAESTTKDKVLISGFGAAKADLVLGDGIAANFKVTNMADPIADQDAATKKYVDAGITNATAAGRDNLGNHLATESIKLSAFSISNDGGTGKGLTFDTQGNAILAQDLTINGNLYTPSDRNLKSNIETLTTVLQKINQIRGVSFEYKDQTKYATGVKIGVIAQELQKVYPEMVTKGKDGFLKVDYTQLTGMLIQAVKEQQEEIDGLKIRMDKQQEQINNILKKMQ
ncbi:tail fiber domain-containing protein [Pedobacter hiemivivus]|uniref:Tail fiber domain-containing protein n=1 Tax=Pedobacter hiemivivus TaxID=2530454 RepID=A0A4U1GUB6_9SPHI|nr:tail fiber domain-containing protein [Pedobacter hiemivivus]TKC65552.1 tail fiber domain-containing protein [Pedobacter hiemivivus]